MSGSSKSLPANVSLEQLHKQAKDRVRELRTAGSTDATLAETQFAIAREYGFESWAHLKHFVEALRPRGIAPFERLAADLATAYMFGQEAQVRAINADFGTAFPTDFHGTDQVQRCLPGWFSSADRSPELAIADARQMVSHAYGFENWAQFAAGIAQPAAHLRPGPAFVSSKPPFYEIDWKENRLSVRGPQTLTDWDEVSSVIEEYRISKVDAPGITDDAIRRLVERDSVTYLNVGGSKGLTDEGARHLARMTQLVELEIGGQNTPLTDRGFEAIRHLTNLRHFKACWTPGFDDQAAAYLRRCDRLESVNVLGSGAGDGLIHALEGKTELRFLETGSRVSDAGIPGLHRIPAFRSWLGGEIQPRLMGTSKLPNRLVIDGQFTDAGLSALEGLKGIAALSFFLHSNAFTAAGLEVLRSLPKLELFGMDGRQCCDEALRQIATLPRLRHLQVQGAIAGDAGWKALSRSQTLEYIWGRECPNFTSGGLIALADLPSLKGMGISCKLVEGALAALPSFPALREFVSIGVTDAGFRYVGQCADLESLYCMYCRDTGDVSAEHIQRLNLRTYYAGMTQLTDRGLGVLSHMKSLEDLEFWQCMALTDAGIGYLTNLPRLQRITIHNSPKVSRDITQRFPKTVQVRYSN